MREAAAAALWSRYQRTFEQRSDRALEQLDCEVFDQGSQLAGGVLWRGGKRALREDRTGIDLRDHLVERHADGVCPMLERPSRRVATTEAGGEAAVEVHGASA